MARQKITWWIRHRIKIVVHSTSKLNRKFNVSHVKLCVCAVRRILSHFCVTVETLEEAVMTTDVTGQCGDTLLQSGDKDR